MKTIIHKQSGKVLYATAVDFSETETEIAIDEKLTQSFVKPFFNQITREFYEGATPEEIAQNNLSTVPEIVTAVKLFGQLLIQGINEASLIAKIDFLVENSIITPLQGDLAKVAIAKATIFERNHPFVTLVGSAFSINIDELFINADNLAI